MLKVATIVGTRPEIIRLSRIIPKFDECFEHVLIHTGQNYDYELNEIFFEQLGLRRPDVYLDAAGPNAAVTIANVISAADRALEEHTPDAVLVLGDTNSCLAVIAAKRRKIPIFHIEAGNRCFDQRVPEEINRKIVDHTSDINLTYSTIARNYLIAEGFPADQIVKVGSPMKEVLDHYREGVERSRVLTTLGLDRGAYFIVSVHREENVDDVRSLQKFASVLNQLDEAYALPIVVSTHPRTRKRLEAADIAFGANIRFSPPFGFLDYVRLQMDAKAVLSDSGTITEEASILGLQAVNLREVHERPEGVEEGAVFMTGLNADRVMDALRIMDRAGDRSSSLTRIVDDYDTVSVSEKVMRIVLSYTDYVKRRVWRA